MEDAVHTLRSAKFALPFELVALKPVFDAGWSLYSLVKDLITDPPNAFSAGKALIESALAVNDVPTSEDRSAFLEVHYRLGWDLRSWFNHGIPIDALFGPIRDDEPAARTA